MVLAILSMAAAQRPHRVASRPLDATGGLSVLLHCHLREARKANEIAAHPEVSLALSLVGFGAGQVRSLAGRSYQAQPNQLTSFLFASVRKPSGLGCSLAGHVIRFGAGDPRSQFEACENVRFCRCEVPLSPALFLALPVLPILSSSFLAGAPDRLSRSLFCYRPAGVFQALQAVVRLFGCVCITCCACGLTPGALRAADLQDRCPILLANILAKLVRDALLVDCSIRHPAYMAA